MRDHLTEKVTVGYPYADRIHDKFHHCLLALFRYDGQWGHRLDHKAPLIAVRGGGNVATARNKIVTAFLEESTADWLWFIDTDQTFEPDIVERLVESADPVERPILSALVFAQTSNRSLPVSPAPVVFDGENIREVIAIPDERWWQVAGAGCGCVLIHRSVLEAVGEKHSADAFPWFKFAQHNRTDTDGNKVPDVMGEDFTFSLRAMALGFPSIVDTTIEAGHLKEIDLNSQHFWAQLPPEQRPRKLWAIIPVKDRLSMTRDLVDQLRTQAGDVGIVVVDNGSGKQTRNWLSSQSDLVVIDGEGMGIHEMWNVGAEYALTHSPANCDVAFLNNDLVCGPDMMAGLQATLAEHQELALVSPNYDDRDGIGVEYVTEICADRYDGTGGIAGFAFMVRGEFLTRYRFPTECKWFFGDNDIVLTVNRAGLMQAIALDVTVEHIGGGGRTTGGWEAMADRYEADKVAWLERFTGDSSGPGVASRRGATSGPVT